MLAVFLGGNGIAVAHRLLWRRSPTLFWLASMLIVIGVGYIVATGLAESIARSLWPVPFDEVKTQEFKLRAVCQVPRQLGAGVVLGPVVFVLAPLVMFKKMRTWLRILSNLLFGVCFILFYISPIPEKVAGLIYPEDALRVPDHCSRTF
jgi:hypothetical protein